MKTITMDYETYQEELLSAKLHGAGLTETLKRDLLELLSGLDSYERDKFEKARRKLYDMIEKFN